MHGHVWVVWSGVLLSGCTSWVGRYGEPFERNPPPQYFEKEVVGHASDQEQPSLRGQVEGEAELRAVGPGGDDPALKKECLASQDVVLRFAWLSDVQLRQREVKLGSKRLSHDLNYVQPTFESDAMAEEYDWAVYLATVMAINDLAERSRQGSAPLSFMIHTGDAMDAGTIEELYQFLLISNYLHVPWYNVLGNHDTAVFGNYDAAKDYALDADVEFYPAARRTTYLWMHGAIKYVTGFDHHLLPIPVGATGSSDHLPTLQGQYYKNLSDTTGVPVAAHPSACHGFDLSTEQRCVELHAPVDCTAFPGFYSFDIDPPKAPISLRVIVLDTPMKNGKWGQWADIGIEQLNWLQRVLAEGGDRLLLVFGHHRPDSLDKRTQQVLQQYANRNLVYFSGHTHQSHLKYLAGDAGHGFFDLNGGSVMNYPQLGRVVEIRRIAGDRGCLVSRWMWPSVLAQKLDELEPPPALSDRQKLVLQQCAEARELTRTSLAQSVQCSHLGTLRDYLRKWVPAWGAAQPFAEARHEANVIIPLRIPTATSAAAASCPPRVAR